MIPADIQAERTRVIRLLDGSADGIWWKRKSGRTDDLFEVVTFVGPSETLVVAQELHEYDAALIVEARPLVRQYAVALAEIERLRAERDTLMQESRHATQALIYAVQAHPQGDIGRDWSSWRVGFGRGVSRGYGRTDAQQLVSAVCQATKHDDPYQVPAPTAEVQND